MVVASFSFAGKKDDKSKKGEQLQYCKLPYMSLSGCEGCTQQQLNSSVHQVTLGWLVYSQLYWLLWTLVPGFLVVVLSCRTTASSFVHRAAFLFMFIFLCHVGCIYSICYCAL